MNTRTKIVIAMTAAAVVTPAALSLAFKLGKKNGRDEALEVLRETVTNVTNVYKDNPETN